MPNVPNVPGVPTLSSYGAGIVTLVTSTVLSPLFGPSKNIWGLFDQNNNAVVVASNVVTMDFRQDFTIADYPIEGGIAAGGAASSFLSYDKVTVPFEVKLRFSQGGGASAIANLASELGVQLPSFFGAAGTGLTQRQAFLNQIEAISGTTQLFNAVTPEKVYPNVNVVHYDYHRAAEQVGIIVVDIWCQEVLLTEAAEFSNTQAPNGASPVSNGTTQAGPSESLPTTFSTNPPE